MKIGYQLYSALEFCNGSEELKNTIHKIAEMGYDGVEFFSYEGIPADEMKACLHDCGIQACNSHVNLERLEKDAEGEFCYAKKASIPCITIPWLSPELRNTEGYSKVKAMIPKLIALGEKYGIELLYHNHDFEFEKESDGKFHLNSILESDSKIKLELDTFWAFYAGVDPVEYMNAVKDKLSMIHIKDYLNTNPPSFAAIGTGNMKNIPILDWAKSAKLEWVIVEQDNSSIDIFESAKLSVDYLKTYYKI